MKPLSALSLSALLGLLAACSPTASPPPEPPMAKAVPHELEKHGHVRTDDYFWLRERENPEVMAYLEAENAYLDAVLRHTEPLQETLYEEIVSRMKQDDDSVPAKRGGDYFYTRVVEGGEYFLHCRKKGSLEAPEEVMLDGNELARGHDYFSLVSLRVSSGRDILAYAVDTVGRNFYTVRFKNLETGEALPDVLADVNGNIAWANDNRTLFYIRQHPETLRSYRLYRHTLGTDPSEDVLVYEEVDETYGIWVATTRTKKYVVMGSYHTLASEVRYLDADDPTSELRVFLPRQRHHEYSIAHLGDTFYVRTNYEARNFRLMKTPAGSTGMESWEEVIPHRDDVYLEDFQLFRDHLVVSERKEGLPQMRIMSLSGTDEHYLDFGEPAYVAYMGENYDPDTNQVRYLYSSLTTPWSTYDYDMDKREKALLKQDEVVGGFDSANYETERLWVAARDGKTVPVSVVFRKGTVKDASHPLLLFGYGSYGVTTDPIFNSAALSLLDRGFIYAVAHIRGSQLLGREWYEDGKLLNKMNTFTDFVDVADYFVSESYTSREGLFAMGGSAGGLLMGTVTNMRPDLFKGVIASVPFVDVITTMLDPDIPLTTGEYDEWGDPNEKAYYDYILHYSPYDNVEARAYPNLLVTTGLHDSQVQYWEPAKWVAKLRALKTDSNRLLLHTNMEAGHSGSTGRFKQHRQTALNYAFLLDLAGITS